MSLVDVVKYNGGPDVYAWKFPGEALCTMIPVIVNESQEAVFVKGGQICDVLGPGHHMLSTDNLPILSKVAGGRRSGGPAAPAPNAAERCRRASTSVPTAGTI